MWLQWYSDAKVNGTMNIVCLHYCSCSMLHLDKIVCLHYCSCIMVHCEVAQKTNKMQHCDIYYEQFLNMFRASLFPSSEDQAVCYCTWCDSL